MSTQTDETTLHKEGRQTPTPGEGGTHETRTPEGSQSSVNSEDDGRNPDHFEDESRDSEHSDDESETFPRAYVEKLRQEAGDARVKAKDRDDLAARLHTALVATTGRLADPSDLPFDEDHLGDEDALTAALDDLLARKPHLASRRPRGDVGQGVAGSAASTNLAGILRSRA